MPNPRTIEGLLKMKPCPFEEGKEILRKTFEESKHLMDGTLYDYCSFVMGNNSCIYDFKMPDGYYHLPPDKQLGLPLGLWHTIQLKPLIDVLPYGVIEKYTNGDTSIINCPYGQDYRVTNYNLVSTHNRVAILKQPPNLYNPLDHKEEVLMENNSANEAQPAKETENMELPFEDINNKIQGLEKRLVKLEDMLSPCTSAIAKAPTVEVPVEPEQITIEEAYESDNFYYIEDRYPKHVLRMYKPVGTQWRLSVAKQILELNENHTVFYATDPTWLAWKAEQEGESE